MKLVCFKPPSLDKRSDKWLIDNDVAQAVYTIKSRANHVWTNVYIYPPHTHEGFHFTDDGRVLLETIRNEETNFITDYI